MKRKIIYCLITIYLFLTASAHAAGEAVAGSSHKPLPKALTLLYGLEEASILDFQEQDLNGDGRTDRLWLIRIHGKPELVCHNNSNRMGRYPLAGSWDSTALPKMILQPLDRNQGAEIVIYDSKQGLALREIFTLFSWNMKVLFNADDPSFFDLNIRRNTKGKVFFRLNSIFEIHLPESADINPGSYSLILNEALLRKELLDQIDYTVLKLGHLFKQGTKELELITEWKLTPYGWEIIQAQAR